ncbi:MAG: arylamine N-acetyltransferase [Acidimicrobiales bacterium]
MSPLEDVDAYLDRIGLAAPAGLAAVHRAHATSIAFENFDSFAGRPVSLDLAHLEDKMVARRRGGYCFEHNLLLMAALQSLDIGEVAPMLARVRMGPDGSPRPLNHLLLRVVDDAGPWVADVGFGGGGLLDPVPLVAGIESEQSGWRYRLVEDGAELVLQTFQDDAWSDMYGFVPEPAVPVDIEVSNWFTATHPDSPFVTGVMAGARAPDRCLSLFIYGEPVLIERPVGGATTTTAVDIGSVPDLLASRFDLPGVTVDPSGRLAAPER